MDDARRRVLSPALDQAASASSLSEQTDQVVGAFIRAGFQHASVLGERTLEAFGKILSEAKDQGATPTATLQRLFKESPEAIEAELKLWLTAQVDQVHDELTPTQLRYYRAALLESFAGYPLTGDYQQHVGDLGAARAALDLEHGSKGPVLATLLRKIAAGGRSDLLGLIRSFHGPRAGKTP